MQVHTISAKAKSAAKVPELTICKAQALGLTGSEAEAIRLLKSCMLSAAIDDIKPLVLLGHIYLKTGKLADAASAYESALRKAPSGCPLDVYIRLGTSYLDTGKVEDAAAVFGQACIARPCASAWLGAGKAYLRLLDLGNADLCFTEANVLDSENAMIWGYLALVQLLAERDSEADQVRSCCTCG